MQSMAHFGFQTRALLPTLVKEYLWLQSKLGLEEVRQGSARFIWTSSPMRVSIGRKLNWGCNVGQKKNENGNKRNEQKK